MPQADLREPGTTRAEGSTHEPPHERGTDRGERAPAAIEPKPPTVPSPRTPEPAAGKPEIRPVTKPAAKSAPAGPAVVKPKRALYSTRRRLGPGGRPIGPDRE